MRFRFKGKTPAWAPILTGLLLLNIFLQVAATYWIPRWAPIQPDPTHTYKIQFRGGPPYFVQPWLGILSGNGFYASSALIAVFLLLLWLSRDKVERIR